MLYIHGMGHFHPENVIDNQFLEDLNIETNDQWIMERVGIRERRTVLPLDYIRETHNKDPLEANRLCQYTNAQTGAYAARMAMERAQVTPAQVGMVIAGGCLPQYSMPADACLIAAELGIDAIAFDINSACSTFAVQMHMLNQMHADSLPDYILLVIAENVTRSINYADRKVAVLWGDGAAAILLSKKIPTRVTVTKTTIASNPAEWRKVTIPTAGHFFQDGPSVQKFAIKRTVSTINALREASGLESGHHYFIGHQANKTMLDSICNLAAVPQDKHLFNVDQYGNCGAAGAPSVLSQNWSSMQAGDKITLAVAGAGLTWGGMIINFV